MTNLKNLIYSATILVFGGLFVQCGSKSDTLFEELSPEQSGINFTNKVEDTPEMNIFNYRNFYNGAGVAVGDINNDGLPDIYVVSNQGPNKLYLNRSMKGEVKFEDITQKAGVAGKRAFSTGAVMADVNGDGWLDIYVCNSGEKPGDDRANELFINTSPLTPGGGISFEEKAAEYGLDDKGYSTHASFFDYDRDGDLDMFLLENSSYPVNKLGFQNIRDQRDPLAGQKLFRNSPLPAAANRPGGGTHFTDVSAEAGIYGSLIGFGLGITIGDINNDGWPDIYISNDFYERDYLYINQKNGTFKEESKNQMGHESLSSMGADVADINNDGHLDIFSTDMLPWDDYRLKTTMSYDDYNLTDLKLKNDFYYQFSRNMLQLNNGDGTFSEVGALAGVHATDWSWGALIFDMDTDGQKDLFVANGIYKNVTDQDFVQFLNDENTMAPFVSGQKRFDYKEFVSKIKEYAIPNYAFRNEGDLKFTNKATDWGLGNPSFSSGAAYGDLDNDGDLDLVVNNTNQPFQVFLNRSVEKNKTHFLRVKLKGVGQNTFGIGARVSLTANGQTQVLEQMPNRGFESSVDYTMVFGLGTQTSIDSLKVTWPDGKVQRVVAPKIDSDLTLTHANANETSPLPTLNLNLNLNLPFADLTAQTKLDFLHEENAFVDYNRDPLLKQMYSRLGPALAVGDVNADGLDDVFVGAGSGKTKKLFVQQPNGTFGEQSTGGLNFDAMAEVVAAQFFDADNDKDLDLLMVTGGNEFFFNDIALTDYLYLNDGKGNFVKDVRFPSVFESGSCVATADFDLDGDIDVFVGGRLVNSKYGLSVPQQLYLNDGKGGFKMDIAAKMPQHQALGMVTDAVWTDLNGDRFPELIVTQDWGAVVVFDNQKGQQLVPNEVANTNGWWNRIKSADLDGDGDLDFVVGNTGRNTRIFASEQNPAELYAKDVDGNGIMETFINCMAEDGINYPMLLKTDLQKAVPSIKKKYIYFTDYGKKQLNEIFDKGELNDAVVRKVTQPNSGILLNDKGVLTFKALPTQVQFAPIYGIETVDYDQDGKLDLLLAGNFFDILPELGRYDANYGLLLRNKGQATFEVVLPARSGFAVRGQVRNLQKLKTSSNKPLFVLAKNSDKVQVFGLK